MKIHKSFLWFAMCIALFSVAVAVYGYEVDDRNYRLDLEGVTVLSEDSVSVDLKNPTHRPFDLVDLHTYSVRTDDDKKDGMFSHSLGDELPAIGVLEYRDTETFVFPAEGLSCSEPITVEMHTFGGRLIARWVGIPPCLIEAPRQTGLVKIDDCTAEYYDGVHTVKWELIGADQSKGKVQLRRTSGRGGVTEGWYDMGLCPDLESGKCMTDITLINFNNEGVFVTLVEHRLGTSVVLNNLHESPCFASAVDVVVVAPKVVAPAIPAQKTENVVDKTEYLVEADRDLTDVRVCLEGCKAENQCYDEKTRANYLGRDVYCKGQNWLVQKRDAKSCSADFECASEICSGGLCSTERSEESESWLTKMLKWLDDLI